MGSFEIILIHPTERKAVRLPHLALEPENISDAAFLIEGVRAKYGLDSVVLKRLGATRGVDRRFDSYRYALLARSLELPAGLDWSQGAAAEEALEQARSVNDDQPWANPGWWPGMASWVDETCATAGLPEVAATTQVRAWDLSAIVEARLTNGEILYFKAVPRAFAAELSLTAWLAETLVDAGIHGRGPGVVATDRSRRCMLLRACDGARLDTVADLATWERVLRDYAAIQQLCAPHADQLASLGLPRRLLTWLPGAWERLASDRGALQPGSHADLTDEEVTALCAVDGRRVKEWVATLAALRIPETLEHGDFHSLNVFVGAARTTIIDWTDAAIAHPFFSLACFLRSLRYARTLKDQSDAPKVLAAAYLSCWANDHTSHEALTFALPAVIGLGAVFQAVHYRERINPLIDKYEEIRSAVPAYVREVLAADRRA